MDNRSALPQEAPISGSDIDTSAPDSLPKTAKQLEKEAKKAEKLAKLASKTEKKAHQQPSEPKEKAQVSCPSESN